MSRVGPYEPAMTLIDRQPMQNLSAGGNTILREIWQDWNATIWWRLINVQAAYTSPLCKGDPR